MHHPNVHLLNVSRQETALYQPVLEETLGIVHKKPCYLETITGAFVKCMFTEYALDIFLPEKSLPEKNIFLPEKS